MPLVLFVTCGDAFQEIGQKTDLYLAVGTTPHHPAPPRTRLHRCPWVRGALLNPVDPGEQCVNLGIARDIFPRKLEKKSRFFSVHGHESLLRVVAPCNPVVHICSVAYIRCRIKCDQFVWTGKCCRPSALCHNVPVVMAATATASKHHQRMFTREKYSHLWKGASLPENQQGVKVLPSWKLGASSAVIWCSSYIPLVPAWIDFKEDKNKNVDEYPAVVTNCVLQRFHVYTEVGEGLRETITGRKFIWNWCR